MKKAYRLIKKLLSEWLSEDSFTQSAAAAYYAVFSLPGLILVTVVTATFFYDRAVVEDEINRYMDVMIGQDISLNLQKMMDSIRIESNGYWAVAIGLGAILFGASRFFVQLQKSMNHVWRVKPPQSSSAIKRVVKKRLLSVVLVLCVGFVLMLTLTVTTLLSVLSDYIAVQIPYLNINTMVIVNRCAAYGIVVLLFTLIYKVIPDVKVWWWSALFGALISAGLFTAGQSAINYYFSVTDPQSAFGAAGSIILLMLWVSYAFMILLLGSYISKLHMDYKTGKLDTI